MDRLGKLQLEKLHIWEVAAIRKLPLVIPFAMITSYLSEICPTLKSVLQIVVSAVQFSMTFFSWLFFVSGKKIWIKKSMPEVRTVFQIFFDCDFFGCYYFTILWFFAGAGPCIILGVVFGRSGRIKKYYPKSLILKCICKFRGISKKISVFVF